MRAATTPITMPAIAPPLRDEDDLGEGVAVDVDVCDACDAVGLADEEGPVDVELLLGFDLASPQYPFANADTMLLSVSLVHWLFAHVLTALTKSPRVQ